MNFVVCALFLLMISSALSNNATEEVEKTRPKVTRTSLHVARNLDPDESEIISVRSKNGDLATLIVKKREDRKGYDPRIQRENPNRSGIPKIQDSPTLLRMPKSKPLPNPVDVSSDVVYVKDELKKRGRNVRVDEDGVPIVEGIRVPDSPEDRIYTWRNARVINGVLVPYKQALVPEIPLKNKKVENKDNPEKQEITLSSYFQADQEKMSMFSNNDAVKTQWKGIAESLPVLKPKQKPPSMVPLYPENHAKIIEYIRKINEKEIQNRKKSGRSIMLQEAASRRMDENVDENEEPLWVNIQPKEIWTENGKISVATRRMDEAETSENIVYGFESAENKFQPISPVQARLLQPQGISSYRISSLYASHPSRVSFEEGVRTPVLQYAHPELGAQPAKVESESDEAEASRMEIQKGSLPSLIYFSNDPYADRSPYAYEPGLIGQSDNTLTSSSSFHAQDVSNNLGISQERENGRGQSSVQDIEFTTPASDAVSINPDEIDITESTNHGKSGGYFSDGYRDPYGLGSDKYIKRYTYSNKYDNSYPMTKEEYYKWKMAGMTYGNNQSPSYYVKISDNRPFWEKITESIKETVQSGVESMKDLTRPVMEPIVEATQRISENLGINEATAKISSTLGFKQGTGMRTALQEKIGAAAASSPVLLPALGLVAGGAALGLGAVAVGRLLDVNVNLLKRSKDGEYADASDLEMEHKRALKMIESGRELTEKAGNETGTDEEKKTNKNDNSGKKEAKTIRSLPMNEETKNTQDKETSKDFKRLIDESGIEGLEKFHFNVQENEGEHKSRRRSLILYEDDSIKARGRRRRSSRSAKEEDLNSLTGRKQEVPPSTHQAVNFPGPWGSTECAKKIFCDVMIRQSPDAVVLMEKKMASLLSKMKIPEGDSVSHHLDQVTEAVRLQDCSQFKCYTINKRR